MATEYNPYRWGTRIDPALPLDQYSTRRGPHPPYLPRIDVTMAVSRYGHERGRCGSCTPSTPSNIILERQPPPLVSPAPKTEFFRVYYRCECCDSVMGPFRITITQARDWSRRLGPWTSVATDTRWAIIQLTHGPDRDGFEQGRRWQQRCWSFTPATRNCALAESRTWSHSTLTAHCQPCLHR